MNTEHLKSTTDSEHPPLKEQSYQEQSEILTDADAVVREFRRSRDVSLEQVHSASKTKDLANSVIDSEDSTDLAND